VVGPAVPPKKNRKNPWEYDMDLYKRWNEVKRMFRRLKGFRRIAASYAQLGLTKAKKHSMLAK
jgi:transposase